MRPHPLLVPGGAVLALAGLALASAAPSPATDPVPGQDAVVLEESMEVEIASETRALVRYTNRTQILTARGVELFDHVEVDYNPSIVVRSLRGVVIQPDGRRVPVKKDHVFDRTDFEAYELYDDSRQRVLSFPGVVPGATVEHSYELEVRNLFYLPRDFLFEHAVPSRSLSFTVRAPIGFPLRTTAQGPIEYAREEQPPLVIHRWRRSDVPALRREHDMPPVDDFGARVVLYLDSILWDDVRIESGSWEGIGRWYWTLARDRMEPTAEVSAKARELTAGLTEPPEKIRRLYEFVQGRVNYVAIALGIGGYQPHASGDVLRNLYGDCKDKATLLIAMMKAVGLVGHPVLILTRDAGIHDAGQPTPGFNHVIVAVPQPQGYLFLDPTSTTAPFGELPWSDQGASALVVLDEGRSHYVVTPVQAAQRNATRWSATATLGPDGVLLGNYLMEAWGASRSAYAGFLDAAKPTERDDALAFLMSRLCPGAELIAHDVVPPAGPADPLRLQVRFRVPGFLVKAGGTEVVAPHLVRFPDLGGLGVAMTRRHSLFLPFLENESSEVRLYLSGGRTPRRIPGKVAVQGPGFEGTTTYELERDGDRAVFVVRRAYALTRRETPTADYAELRRALTEFMAEESRAISLAPPG